MNWLQWTVIALLLLAMTAVALTFVGRVRWRGLTNELLDHLHTARVIPQPARFDARELDGLPAPVQRYLRAALTDGMPVVVAASIGHSGTFNMSETGAQWKPFTSLQQVVTQRPGFVWDGRVRLLPGLAVHVHDAYVAGEGVLHPAVQGLFTIVNLRDSGSLAHDELMRYLAEAAWYPTALLPSQGMRWQAVDARSADATLSDGAMSATLRFHFGDDGLIAAVHADARGRAVGSVVTPTAWEGRWFDYELRDGMQVPDRGEVAWLLPEGRHAYWRGSVTSLDYEFAAPAR